MKITEVIIDASQKFQDRRNQIRQDKGTQFIKKILGIASDIPGALQSQNDLEKMANDNLSTLLRLPNKIFNKERLQLAPLYKGFQKTVSILSLLEWYTSEPYIDNYAPEDIQLAKNFVSKNIDKILYAIHLQEVGLEELRNKFVKLKWSAPWDRYTNYGYVAHEIRLTKRYFEEYKKKNLA